MVSRARSPFPFGSSRTADCAEQANSLSFPQSSQTNPAVCKPCKRPLLLTDARRLLCSRFRLAGVASSRVAARHASSSLENHAIRVLNCLRLTFPARRSAINSCTRSQVLGKCASFPLRVGWLRKNTFPFARPAKLLKGKRVTGDCACSDPRNPHRRIPMGGSLSRAHDLARRA